MKRTPWLMLAVGFTLMFSACDKTTAPASKPNAASVTLQVVKQEGYLSALKSLRGKIVVVDLWGEF
ncbi:MAG TPA: hypothetical protein VE988_07015 [Gemmataceae bacterium]|nr:hypothetical protein [Gemmataceae bacterium]